MRLMQLFNVFQIRSDRHLNLRHWLEIIFIAALFVIILMVEINGAQARRENRRAQ